ncbi:MAG: hypothetical protein H6736_03610 [Alphaproteobacteria bacterium]|nr:hypothetical protein [Alphaproteobacteria bacterium]
MAPSGGYGHGFTLDVTRDPAVQALLVEAFDATTVGDGLTVRQWVERKRAGDVASLGHLLDVERRRDTTLSTFDAEGLPVHSFWVRAWPTQRPGRRALRVPRGPRHA